MFKKTLPLEKQQNNFCDFLGLLLKALNILDNINYYMKNSVTIRWVEILGIFDLLLGILHSPVTL